MKTTNYCDHTADAADATTNTTTATITIITTTTTTYLLTYSLHGAEPFLRS